jgi:hypothetical protein
MAAAFAIVGIVGGVITFALMWPYGVFLALACTPIGGSSLVLLVAAWKAWNSNGDDEDEAPPDDPRSMK